MLSKNCINEVLNIIGGIRIEDFENKKMIFKNDKIIAYFDSENFYMRSLDIDFAEAGGLTKLNFNYEDMYFYSLTDAIIPTKDILLQKLTSIYWRIGPS